MTGVLTIAAVAASIMSAVSAAELPEIEGIRLRQLRIPSSVDGAEQPVVIGIPEGYDPATQTPLLIGLHTWSADYLQRVEAYATQAARRGWLVVLPNFRGPNCTTNPNAFEAGGSILAQHDIVDARQYMVESFNVDPARVYITGDSGGGHMTMLMCAKYPDLFSAAAAWVAVTDLREWWELGNTYRPHIEAVCGGAPGDSAQVDFEYLRRSPRTFMTNLAHTRVLLAHGDRDFTIPVEQAWRSFRVLGDLPAHHTIFQVFSGGHEADHEAAFAWLSSQVAPPQTPTELHLVTDESKSYYWAELEVAGELMLGKADLVFSRDTLSVATENLSGLSLHLRDLPLPEDGVFLTVRSDRDLALRLTGLPAGLNAQCPWASIAADGDALVLTVGPAEEARTLRLSW